MRMVRQEMNHSRPPRIRLIRVFLSLLVGFMAGLAGWTLAAMMVVLRQGPAAAGQLPSLPLPLQVIAFLGPALAAGYGLFSALGHSR
jgi:hypothetical protein